MNKKSGMTPLHRWHEEMTRHLSSMIKSITQNRVLDQNQIEKVSEKIFMDQMRSPWPGSFLAKEKKDAWLLRLKKTLQILHYAAGDAAIEELASKLTSSILRELSASQISSNLLSREEERHTQIEHVIRQEFYLRRTSEETVSRGVQRYFREQSSSRRNTTELKTHENDPLRDLLGLPRIGRTMLPNEDIRVHMAKFLTSSSKLSKLLSFDDSSLDTKLGKEFSSKCKPLGFADKNQRVLIVEVDSPLCAQEVSFQKKLLLSRLNKISGFEEVRELKFKISPRKASPGAR